jgi:hypothetical protein
MKGARSILRLKKVAPIRVQTQTILNAKSSAIIRIKNEVPGLAYLCEPTVISLAIRNAYA